MSLSSRDNEIGAQLYSYLKLVSMGESKHDTKQIKRAINSVYGLKTEDTNSEIM